MAIYVSTEIEAVDAESDEGRAMARRMTRTLAAIRREIEAAEAAEAGECPTDVAPIAVTPKQKAKAA